MKPHSTTFHLLLKTCGRHKQKTGAKDGFSIAHMLQLCHSCGDGKEILVQIVDAWASEPKDSTPIPEEAPTAQPEPRESSVEVQLQQLGDGKWRGVGRGRLAMGL